MSLIFQIDDMPLLEEGKKNAGLIIAIGIIVALTGFLAMVSPFVADHLFVMKIGGMLIIAGIGQLLFATITGKSILTNALGILTIFLGGYMLSVPGLDVASLDAILAAYLFISGSFEAFMYFQTRLAKARGWTLFNSLVSILLAAMMWNQFPLSGAWAIGILIGVRLFSTGLSFLMHGFAARAAVKKLINVIGIN